MAEAQIRLDTRQTGADLRTIADALRRMDAAKVTTLFRQKLDDAAKPVVPAVRAAAVAIPAKGPKTTGLRARIAACIQSTSWAEPPNRQAGVSVWVNVHHMPEGELSLPLMMEGAKRWRHPVYGTEAQAARATIRGHGRGWKWVDQTSHPYFYEEARKLGPAAGDALRRALEDITRQLEGR